MSDFYSSQVDGPPLLRRYLIQVSHYLIFLSDPLFCLVMGGVIFPDQIKLFLSGRLYFENYKGICTLLMLFINRKANML